MQNFLDRLSGKKTYLLSLLAIIKGAAVLSISLLNGEMGLMEFLQSPELNWVLAGGLSATFRSAIKQNK